jgi:predicted phage-related endonuclease
MVAIDVTINRDRYIGGSDLPTIMGWNTFQTRIQFAKEKLKIEPRNELGNQYTQYGHVMESKVRDYINLMFGTKFIEDTAFNEDKRYRGNCDGIDRKRNLLFECKTFHGKLKVDYYTPQCQFYMELFNVDECWLVGYDRPSEFYTGVDYALEHDDVYFDYTFDPKRIVIYKIYRDKEYFNKIEKEIDKFKYLLECLIEEEVMKNGFTNKND